MPTTYNAADESVTDLADEVLARSFPTLARVNLTVGCLLAHNPDGPAIKIAGHPVTDRVRIVSLKDRAAGLPDVQVIIDKTWWDEQDDDARCRMFWRAFKHLQLVPASDKEEESGDHLHGYKIDDLGRPKLKFRPCDYMTSGFYGSVELFGEQSPEVAELRVIGAKVRELVQREFWG